MPPSASTRNLSGKRALEETDLNAAAPASKKTSTRKGSKADTKAQPKSVAKASSGSKGQAASKQSGSSKGGAKEPKVSSNGNALSSSINVEQAQNDASKNASSTSKQKAKGPSKASSKQPRSSKPKDHGDQARGGSNSGQDDNEDTSKSTSAPETKDRYPIRPRKRYGPNGELKIPRTLPAEAADTVDKKKIVPLNWTQFDGTPGRCMTTRDPNWWEEHHEWLEKNAKDLKFNESTWKKKAEASKKDAPQEQSTDPILTTKTLKGHEDYDWVCACRPNWDIEGRNQDDDDDVEDSGDPCGKQCKIDDLSHQHPGHLWIRTMRGCDRFMFWYQEQLKRDPDEFAMHIYNDFGGYGQLEVLQNMILAFDKSFKQAVKTGELLALWGEIEGMAWWLNFDVMRLMMIDDAEGLFAHYECIGRAMLNTIRLLMDHDEFKPNSSIKNLGLILAMFVRISRVEGVMDECDWVKNMVNLADKNGIDISGISSMQKEIEEVRDSNGREPESEDELEGEEAPRFGDINGTGEKWGKSFALLKASHAWRGFGGKQFDIPRMSQSEKKKYSLGNGGMMW